MTAQLLINEIHPNQVSGSEWVELWWTGTQAESVNLLNYTLHDEAKQIYKFSNEALDQSTALVVVEVSGLNNDQDSVVLKDPVGNIIDEFNYTSTSKGLSWSRVASDKFVLSEPSKGLPNPVPTPTPTPTPTTTPTITPVAPTGSSSNTTPTPVPTTASSDSSDPNLTSANSSTTSINPIATTATNKHYYPLSKIRLQTATASDRPPVSRLVLIEDRSQQIGWRNVIIISLLLILSSGCLLYVKLKSRRPPA